MYCGGVREGGEYMNKSKAQKMMESAIRKNEKAEIKRRKGQISAVYVCIKKRAKDGYGFIQFDSLYNETIQQLKKDGFSVKYDTVCKCCVSWQK